MTENARRNRMNLPPPFHGESTWPSSPPVPPLVKASVYSSLVIVINSAPTISTKVIGMKRPKNVRIKILTGGVLTGRRQL
jgi:hypothetical protein